VTAPKRKGKLGAQGRVPGPSKTSRGYGPETISRKQPGKKKNAVYRVDYFAPGAGSVTRLGNRGTGMAGRKTK
jgi:hypothetical protein